MTPEQRAELRSLCGLAELDNDGEVRFKGSIAELFAFGVAKHLPALLDYVEKLEDRAAVLQVNFEQMAETCERLNEVNRKLKSLRAQNYRITVTIEATASPPLKGYCGKGSTVAEAVLSLGEMMKGKEGIGV